jgi:hypothetical protein
VLFLPPASEWTAQPRVELDGKTRVLQSGGYDSGTGLTTIKAIGVLHPAKVTIG